jgi:hypothetical protein
MTIKVSLIILAATAIAACGQVYHEGDVVKIKPGTPFTFGGIEAGQQKPSVGWQFNTSSFMEAQIVSINEVYHNAIVEFPEPLASAGFHFATIPETGIIGYTGPECTYPVNRVIINDENEIGRGGQQERGRIPDGVATHKVWMNGHYLVVRDDATDPVGSQPVGSQPVVVEQPVVEQSSAQRIMNVYEAYNRHDSQWITQFTSGSINYFGHNKTSNNYIIHDMANDANTYLVGHSTYYPATFTHEVSNEYSPRWTGPMVYDSITAYTEVQERNGRLHQATVRLTVGYTFINNVTTIYALVEKVL